MKITRVKLKVNPTPIFFSVQFKVDSPKGARPCVKNRKFCEFFFFFGLLTALISSRHIWKYIIQFVKECRKPLAIDVENKCVGTPLGLPYYIS